MNLSKASGKRLHLLIITRLLGKLQTGCEVSSKLHAWYTPILIGQTCRKLLLGAFFTRTSYVANSQTPSLRRPTKVGRSKQIGLKNSKYSNGLQGNIFNTSQHVAFSNPQITSAYRICPNVPNTHKSGLHA